MTNLLLRLHVSLFPFVFQAAFVIPTASAFFSYHGSFQYASHRAAPVPLCQTNDRNSPLSFTDTVFDEIAGKVQDHFSDVPFVPAPLVTYCLKQVLGRMAQDLAPDTLLRINEVIMAEETATAYDDFSESEVRELADEVSRELSSMSVVDLPMLTSEQEHAVLKQIVRVVFEVLTTSEEERQIAWISTNLDKSRNMLASPERRKQLASTINAAVDIPLLREDQEEAVLVRAIEQCASTVEKLLPPDLLSTLKGESPEGLSEMKEYLIETVNQRVNLIGFSEDQEAAIIRAMCEILVDSYADDIETEMLLLSHEEQQGRLQEKIEELEWELKASKARFQREQTNLKAQLDRIKLQLD